MRQLSRLLFLALVLGLLMPLPLRADEDPVPADDPEKPAPEKPAPEKEAEKDDGKPPEILRDDPEDEMEEPEVAEEIVWRQRTVSELHESPLGVKAPAGMVYVPAGKAVIGTTATALAKLLEGRPPTIQKKFAFETPEHIVPMGGYFIDRYEVTNAQYHAFLKDHAYVKYVTSGALANLDEVAAHILHVPLLDVAKKRAPYSRQLYEANKAKLHEKFPDLIVKDGQDPEEATYRKIRRAPLPRDVEIEFYSLVPPKHWEGMMPPEALLDHPVRFVSYNDAAIFAEWAGKHIPTEQEWEYAARGPEAFLWPWGDYWFPDVRYANWGAKIVNSRYQATSVPVDGNPPQFAARWQGDIARYNGMSWCGVWHLLGNVWEWTSSWFTPYPGNKLEHDYTGQYVKVIRGASYEDGDPIALRIAARNYIGIGMKRPPLPVNAFKNVGFRLAWYGNPGQDQIEPILRRVTRDRQVKEAMIDLSSWVGATATKFAADGSEVENHVYVSGRTHSVVLMPLTSVLKADDKAKLKKRNDLLKASVAQPDPFPLAVIHTDVPLTKIFVLDREAARKAAEESKGGKKRGGRRRQKPKAPPTKQGDLPAGTYVLAFWHERLCLCLSSLDFRGFLSKGKTPEGQLTIKALKEARPGVTLEVDPDADLLEIGFALPIGGAKNDENLTLIVQKVLIEATAGALESAGTWQKGHYGNVPQKPGGKTAAETAAAEAAEAEKNKPAGGLEEAKPADAPGMPAPGQPAPTEPTPEETGAKKDDAKPEEKDASAE